MTKLIRKHQWLTAPNSKGISYYGLTDFSKDYFLRLDSITHQHNLKTRYNLHFPTHIKNFLTRTSLLHNIPLPQLHSNLSQLTLSQRTQYMRFCIEQDQPFSQLNSVQFNIQLTAPISMRILKANFQAFYHCRIYDADWLYEVEILDMEGWMQKRGLMSQEEYGKVGKIIEYDGMVN